MFESAALQTQNETCKTMKKHIVWLSVWKLRHHVRPLWHILLMGKILRSVFLAHWLQYVKTEKLNTRLFGKNLTTPALTTEKPNKWPMLTKPRTKKKARAPGHAVFWLLRRLLSQLQGPLATNQSEGWTVIWNSLGAMMEKGLNLMVGLLSLLSVLPRWDPHSDQQV